MIHQNHTITELVDGLMLHMADLGYTQNTRERYLAYYRVFIKYTNKQEISEFTLELGKKFLWEHHGYVWQDGKKQTISENYLRRHIEILYEFQTHGRIITKRHRIRTYEIGTYSNVLEAYLGYLRDCGLCERTIETKRHTLLYLFEHLIKQGINDLSLVSSKDIYDFLCSKMYFSIATKECYQYTIRALLKYLADKGLCRKELSGLFEVISVRSKNAYPSYFTPDAIAQILEVVDVSTITGKRDYAILLLAAELGLRIGDIRRLKISEINFAKRHIRLTQQKSYTNIDLPISGELVTAMADYLKNARPESKNEEVFLANRAPRGDIIDAHFLYGMLQKYIGIAGIEIPDRQKHGMHALRSSLASNMLRNGISMPVISNVLGHKYSDTANHYLKIDVAGLRRIALEVPTL